MVNYFKVLVLQNMDHHGEASAPVSTHVKENSFW